MTFKVFLPHFIVASQFSGTTAHAKLIASYAPFTDVSPGLFDLFMLMMRSVKKVLEFKGVFSGIIKKICITN